MSAQASVRDLVGDIVTMVRATLPEGGMKATPFAGIQAHPVRLWWGATVEAHPGDVLHYFETPIGAAIEAVGRPA